MNMHSLISAEEFTLIAMHYIREPIIYYSSYKSIIIHKWPFSACKMFYEFVHCSLLHHSFSVCLYPIYINISHSLSFILTVKYSHWQIGVSVEKEIQSEGKQIKRSRAEELKLLLF